MTLKSSLLIGLWLFVVWTSEAQPLPGNGAGAGTGMNLSDHMMIMDSKKFGKDEGAEPVVGTPYLTEAFVNGDVYSKKGKFSGLPMRYNIYTDNIEFKEKNATYILDPSADIRKVDMGTYRFVVEQYEVKGKSKLGFFTLLDSGKVTLMSKKEVNFREKQPPKALETDWSPAKYTPAGEEYHFKIGSGPLQKVSSVKKLIESLPDKQDEVKEFAGKEKISKNEEELTKLIKFYNSL
jgi:hypothetical protein